MILNCIGVALFDVQLVLDPFISFLFNHVRHCGGRVGLWFVIWVKILSDFDCESIELWLLLLIETEFDDDKAVGCDCDNTLLILFALCNNDALLLLFDEWDKQLTFAVDWAWSSVNKCDTLIGF